MKYFTAINLLALCVLATSHGFVLEEEKADLASSAVGIISNLKNSALQKKEAIIQSVKDTAKNKWSYVTSIKDAKISAVKNAVESKFSKLAAFEEAKKSFVKSLLASSTDKLVNAYSIISSKVNGLHQYKLNLKDKATSLIRSSASNIHSTLSQKKELISKIKTPASSNKLLLLQPIIKKEEPITVHTYVSHEPAVFGKVFVPEIQIPFQNYEPQGHITYGPPANTYGPSVIPS